MSETAANDSSACCAPASGWTLRETAKLTLAAGVIAVFGMLAFQARAAIMLLFAGIVLATALKPVVTGFRRTGANHAFSVSVMYGILVVALLAVMGYAVPLIVEQTTALVAATPATYESMHQAALESGIPLVPYVAERLPAEWPEETVRSLASLASRDALGAALGFGGAAARSVLYLMAILLLAFYWSLNEMRTTRAMVMFLSPERRERARELIAAVQEKLGQYVRGQAFVCAVVGLMFLVSTWLLGVPYAIPLAIAATLFEAIPILGPALGAAPAIVVAFSVSPGLGMAMAAVALGIHLIEANILIPRVMEKAVGLSAVATMLAIVAFGALCGLMGAILAIPLAALVQLLLERLLLEPEPVKDPARDLNARLRLEAQELVQDVRKQLRNREAAANDDTDRWEDEIESIAALLDVATEAPGAEPTSSRAPELVR